MKFFTASKAIQPNSQTVTNRGDHLLITAALCVIFTDAHFLLNIRKAR